MKKRLFSIMGLSLLAAFALAVVPARAQNVDEKIKVLEQELSQLKDQQIELKKEATAAAAALPTFSYRPGNGMNIEAADKSWSFRASLESHFRYNFESGRDQVGRSRGELFGRRFRPYFFYCLNNCLWEMEAALDLDGFGTGNAKNSTNTGGNSILQRGAVKFHGENINPWLPMVQFGMEVQNAQGGSIARQGSGATGAQAEYDLHSRNNGFNTGRAGQGIVLNWDNKPLSSIGIPGRITKLQFGMSAIAEGDDGLQSFTDRKDFNLYMGIQPFSQIKNKWISGFTFDYGAWFCNIDARKIGGAASTTFASGNGCGRYRVQDHGDGGRQALVDFGSDATGDGLHVAHGPGVAWNVGPYTFRVMGHFQGSEDRGGSEGKKSAHSFLIGHDLFLWSPKGFLTGSSSTPGSILIGTHFERVDMSCGDSIRSCRSSRFGAGSERAPNTINDSTNAAYQFRRNRILLREWDIWYFVANRMSVGVNILWYDASNLDNRANRTGQNLGLCKATSATATDCRTGTGGDWTDVMLNWRYQF